MKQRWKKGICLVFGLLLLCGSFTVQAEEEVKVSDKEYMVSLMDANSIFISNQKAVSGKVGTKVFLTYTVEQVTKNAADITGVVATNNPMEGYPYAKDGRIEYANESVLFEEGYTYVYGFEITEDGLSYRCAKMKGKEAKYINFTNFQESADASGAYKHFGIWADGGAGAGVSAILNHVRCYDAQGNDLGVQFNRSTAMMQDEANKLLDVHLTVDTSYSFTMEEASTVAIGNKYVTDSDVVYMEYEVEDEDSRTFTMTDDMYQIYRITGSDNGFDIIGKEVIFPDDFIGTVNIYYYKYPERITSNTNENYQFELSDDALEIMPYGVAGDILKSDVSNAYGNIYSQRYEAMKQQLDPRFNMGFIEIGEGI